MVGGLGLGTAKTKRSKKISPKVDLYKIMSRAIEEGIEVGYRRAHKHTEAPSVEALKEHLQREIMNALDEVIKF